MCGIAGIIQQNSPVSRDALQRMLTCLQHRGPDDEGVWFGHGGGVALGQRRLAIIDLSPGGHQPMVSPDGRFAITFNGEIYNYLELKIELTKLGWNFQTKSDTEVLLAAYIEWREKCLEKLNGMFAWAVWDEKEKTLFAARDRLGEKPFKYYCDAQKFIFASELKAILTDPSIPREPDWSAVDAAMTYRFVPAPQTGFRGIEKLAAGHYLVWKNGAITVTPYWQAYEFARENTERSLPEWQTLLWDTFKDSVRGRLLSDVPVGAFLSGGLDSSSVVAAMAEVNHGKIKTFSVGFKNRSDSELPYAKLIADRYATDHTEIYIEPDIVETLPELVYHCEEPFFDNAAVPTLAMAKETRKHVTVVLTGDGGDELFGGYTNQVFFDRLSRYQRLPTWLYQRGIPGLAGALSTLIPAQSVKKFFYRAEVLGHNRVQAYVDYYAIWKKDLPRSHFYITKDDLYTAEMRAAIDFNFTEKLMSTWLGLGRVERYGHKNRAMLADIVGRLGDNYLMKVDYTSMVAALENRTPFLDHRLVELALSLPDKFKVKHGVVKWIWKDIVKSKVPAPIIARRKAGFGIPIGEWMRHELSDYVNDNLLQTESKLYRYFDKQTIARLIRDHHQGQADYSNHIWCLLLLDRWLKTFF